MGVSDLVALFVSRLKLFASNMMVDTARPVINPLEHKKEDGIGYCTGSWISDDGRIRCGFASFRGRRASMEDCYDVKLSNIDSQSICLFGVFDGHGGSRASEYLKEHLFDNLLKHPKFMKNTKLAIRETFNQTDSGFLNAEREKFRDDGSTASTAIMVGNHLYVANVGDSRTVMSKSGKAVALSEDHKPNRQDERKRIEKAGGVVMWTGTWRVGGVLAMSRAFGNRLLKQFVVADPDIQDLEIGEDAELLVLASDGLWDVISNEDAISIALSEEEPEAAAKKLTETAFTRGSCDNITCIVVKFPRNKLDQSTSHASAEKSGSPNSTGHDMSPCSQTGTFEKPASANLRVAGSQVSETEQTISSNQSAKHPVSCPGLSSTFTPP